MVGLTQDEVTYASIPHMPLWVCKQIFPYYFGTKQPRGLVLEDHERLPKRRRTHSEPPIHPTVFFSHLKVTSANMTSTIHYGTDPKTLVTFHVDQGHVMANFLRPLCVTSPGMVTCFPKLVPEAHQAYEGATNERPPELDLTMKGAGPEQLQFKAFMDGLDDALLEFVFNHQTVVGKANLTRAQIEMMMKRQFRPRVSIKTGKQYPDALTCRYKAKDTPIQVVDSECRVVDLAANPTAVTYNDVVRVAMRYNGPYIRGGSFGNSWEMLCVQVVGHAENHSACEPAEYFGEPLDPAKWPTIN